MHVMWGYLRTFRWQRVDTGASVTIRLFTIIQMSEGVETKNIIMRTFDSLAVQTQGTLYYELYDFL